MGFLYKKLKGYSSFKGNLKRDEYVISSIIFFSLTNNFNKIIISLIFDFYILLINFFQEYMGYLTNIDLWNLWDVVYGWLFIPLFFFPAFCLFSISIQRTRDMGWHFGVGVLAWISLLCNSYFGPAIGFSSRFFNLLLIFVIPLVMVDTSDNTKG